MSNPPLDLASFIAAVLAVFVAPPLAHFMGVYAAIVVAAVFGAGLALVRSEAMPRTRAVGFVALMAGVSMVSTVGAAELLNRFIRLDSINPLLAPLSLIIAAIGRDWPRVARGAWQSARRVFERRAGVPAPGDYAPPAWQGGAYPPPRPPRPARVTDPDQQEGADRD